MITLLEFGGVAGLSVSFECDAAPMVHFAIPLLVGSLVNQVDEEQGRSLKGACLRMLRLSGPIVRLWSLPAARHPRCAPLGTSPRVRLPAR